MPKNIEKRNMISNVDNYYMGLVSNLPPFEGGTQRGINPSLSPLRKGRCPDNARHNGPATIFL